MPSAQKAGFPTYWTSFGQGPRAAVAIHCSLAHSGAWGPLAQHVSGAMTLRAFDMPGHGRSAAWDGRGEIQAVTTDIAAALCDAQTGGPCDVIGHSFGATVALRLAVERPALVRSLVLIEPVFFAVAMRDAPEVWASHEAHTAEFVAAWEVGDTRAAAREFTGLWGDGTPWEDIPEAGQNNLASQMHLILAAQEALHDDPTGMLHPGVLEAVTVPSLLIEGSASPKVISAIQEGLAARLPHAQRSVIAGAGHMLPLTHAGQVAREILSFP